MKPRHTNRRGRAVVQAPGLFDRWLLFAALSLLAIGMLMVTSSSMVIAAKQYHNAFHFIIRQGIYLCVGLLAGLITVRIPMRFWEKVGPLLLILTIVALTLVLIPGIGHSVNGSRRWVGFGPLHIQPSEFAKLAVIFYLAGYLVRHQAAVQVEAKAFLRPFILLGIIALLLLKEPDFGATVVIMSTALAMLFMAGSRLWPFMVMISGVISAGCALIFFSPYRLKRLTAFLDPWADPFSSGYQLTQSLIAFGRGGWHGLGLGKSVQKLFYLPEAHTDFLFAVLVEETGLLGGLTVLALFLLLVSRVFVIARQAHKAKHLYSAYIAYGVAVWLGLQSMVNLGVNAGLLPTKGLTLPLMSYGGSSMIVSCTVIALLLRLDYERRRAA